jgi:hypothetical protein
MRRENITTRKITSKSDFQQWIDVVNTALHDWDMIDAEHYYKCVTDGMFSFYMAFMEGTAVATAAARLDGNEGLYPRLNRTGGAATAVCVMPLENLKNNGAKICSLGSSHEAADLY